MQSAQFQLHAQIEERHWWFVARRQILSAVVDAVLEPDSLIIDVGCGTGANLGSMADQYECIGIDSSSEAIRLARCRFPLVRFIHGQAPHDLGPAMHRARMVLLTDVLEHVADDFALFSELLATAQPGAYFLLTVPADPALWSEHDKAFGHYRRYEVERLEQVWHGLAVRPVFVTPFNARLCPAIKLARHFSRWRGRAAGEAGTDFVLPPPSINQLLTNLFAGERHRLARLARGEKLRAYKSGVSLMALVQRREGTVEPRRKPEHLASDLYDPSTELVTSEA
jgi:SAM-dependent methyltransferase